jgi:hypothetical protein
MIRRLNEQTDEGAGHGARAFVVSTIAYTGNDTLLIGCASVSCPPCRNSYHKTRNTGIVVLMTPSAELTRRREIDQMRAASALCRL